MDMGILVLETGRVPKVGLTRRNKSFFFFYNLENKTQL